jgi:hypothetical protein
VCVCVCLSVCLNSVDILQDMITEMKKATPEGYLAAAKLYESGKYSVKSDNTVRNIKDFPIHSTDPLGKLYTDYSWDPHGLVAAALAGTDDTMYGAFGKGSIANKPDARLQIVQKTIQFQILQLHALHEMEAALAEYEKTDSTSTNPTHMWDEFWAFYTGSGETGTGNGVGPYINGEKRAAFFGTTTTTISDGGGSMVNSKILKAAQSGRNMTLSTGHSGHLQNAAKCIRAQFKVPVIQGCIEYAYKADVTTAYSTTDDAADMPEAAAKAELWAFCSAALPFLNAVDTAAAAAVRTEADFKTDSKIPSFKVCVRAWPQVRAPCRASPPADPRGEWSGGAVARILGGFHRAPPV